MPDYTAIAKLTPAAARLLLAFWTTLPDETYEDIVMRSGITSYLTFVSAKKQLQSAGFWDDESRSKEKKS